MYVLSKLVNGSMWLSKSIRNDQLRYKEFNQKSHHVISGMELAFVFEVQTCKDIRIVLMDISPN